VLRLLQAGGEVGGGGAGSEIAIGIMADWQLHDARSGAGAFQLPGEAVGSKLASLIFILVEDDINRTVGLAGQLSQLCLGEMCAHGASGVAKSCLPQYGQVEEAFHQDHGREVTNRFPGKQTALGSGQEPMRKSRTDTTTIQVDDLAVFATGEDHPTAEGIVALLVDQARVEDPVEAVALSGEMTMEVAARRIADAQFFDDGGMTESTLLQILYGFECRCSCSQ